jgi:sodium transport system permease protein
MTGSGRSAEPSLFAATLLVARKELVTSFRDRQTTLYTLVLPIVLYPFLFWCMIQASLFLEGRREHTETRLGLAARESDLVPPGLAESLARDPHAVNQAGASIQGSEPRADPAHGELNSLSVLPLRAPLSLGEACAWLARRTGSRPASAAIEEPDAVLYLSPAEDGGRGRAEVFYDSSSTRSRIALARVQSRMPVFVRDLRARAAAEVDPNVGALEPFRRDPPRNVAPQPAMGAYILSYILPLLFVIMAVMGAFFPAVDLTCGERERKTAETTLLLPVPRTAVHLGKILAVCAAALIATGLNLSALALSAEHLLRMLPANSTVQVDVPVRALLQVAPLLLLFAFFVSSVLTGVAALARTFKEGQALLGPVQILFVLPALAGALPGVQLTPLLASIPVVNVVLCFRGLLRGEPMPLEYGITAASLGALSIAAIGLSLWTLSREALLVSGSESSWRDLLGILRSPGSTR